MNAALSPYDCESLRDHLYVVWTAVRRGDLTRAEVIAGMPEDLQPDPAVATTDGSSSHNPLSSSKS